MSPLVAVRSTMIVATLAWAAGEALMRRSPLLDSWARICWTTGIALAIVHVALAFQLIYGWDHQAAVEATVRQTAARVGWGWRGGIYVNYVFLALWFADVCWWWVAPASHASRPALVEITRLSLFVFMFLNGAVIFASGISRLAGAASVCLVAGASMIPKHRWLAA